MTWIDRAECLGLGPDAFATSGGRYDVEWHPHVQKALAICADCPVRQECEESMLEWPSPPYRIVIAGMAPRAAQQAWAKANPVAWHDRNKKWREEVWRTA